LKFPLLMRDFQGIEAAQAIPIVGRALIATGC